MLAVRRQHHGVRPRQLPAALSEEPQGAGLSARVRRPRRSSASPTCRARRRRWSSTCRSSPAACRSSWTAARCSRRSASSPICSRCRPTASTGSSWPTRRRAGRRHTRRHRSRCPNIRRSSCATGSPMRCWPDAPMLERDVLPAYLAKRRWFALKDQTLHAARLASLVAAAGRRPRAAAGGDRDRDASGDRALAAAAGDRAGRTSRPARCRRSLRWRACGAARASAC